MRLFLVLAAASICWGQSCSLPEILRPNGAIKAVLTDLKCRMTDGTPYLEFALTFSTEGEVEIAVEAKDPDLKFLLRNAKGRKVGAGKTVRRRVERGVYTVLVNAPKPEDGVPFTLRSSFAAEPNTLCRVFPQAGPNLTIAGQLNAQSCRLLDNSAFDGYSLEILGPGTVEITMESPDFDSYLILRGSGGHAIAEDDNGGGAKNARISIPVRGPETYTLIAAAASESEKSGAYGLTLKFEPDAEDPCRPQQKLEKPQSVSSKMSAADCSTSEGAVFHYYDLKLDAPGQAELFLTSSAFETFLSVVDDWGRAIAYSGAYGSPARSVIKRQLEPGSYRVLVFSVKGTAGDYTLKYDFRAGPPDVCPQITLEAGRGRTGSLGDASCRNEDGLADTYRIELRSSGTLLIEMAASDFPTALVLRDEQGSRMVEDAETAEFAESGRLYRSQILADLPGGAYTVSAESAGTPGGYSIGYQFVAKALPPCTRIQKLELNSSYRNLLSSDSCRGADGQPVDYYEFIAPSDTTIAALMTSGDFDSFLTVEDTTGNVLRADDDSFGLGDALLVQFVPGETYRLGARSARSGFTGLYRVDLLSLPGSRAPGCLPKGALMPGEPLAGSLLFTACQWRDETFADIYRLAVSTGADFEVSLKSGQFDAALVLMDQRGSVIDEDDDGAGNTDSVLRRKLEAGTYYVAVKASSGYVTGTYTLVAGPLP